MNSITLRKASPLSYETTRYDVFRDGKQLGFVCSVKSASWRMGHGGRIRVGLRGHPTSWHAYRWGEYHLPAITRCARIRRDAVLALIEATL